MFEAEYSGQTTTEPNEGLAEGLMELGNIEGIREEGAQLGPEGAEVGDFVGFGSAKTKRIKIEPI